MFLFENLMQFVCFGEMLVYQIQKYFADVSFHVLRIGGGRGVKPDNVPLSIFYSFFS